MCMLNQTHVYICVFDFTERLWVVDLGGGDLCSGISWEEISRQGAIENYL